MILPKEVEGLRVIATCKQKSEVEYYQGDWSKAISYLLLTDGKNHYICYNKGYAILKIDLDEVIINFYI